MGKFRELNRSDSKKERVLFYCITISVFLLTGLVISYLVGNLFQLIEPDGDNYSAWYWGLKSAQGKPVTFILTTLLFIKLRMLFKDVRKNSVLVSDERGVHFLRDNTYGSSRWLTKREMSRSFEVCDINDTHTTIYGQLDQDGKNVVGFKANENGGEGNRNVLTIATMGAGKSFTYVRTEILQAALRGDSVVVTDPSAELYTDLSFFLKRKGLDVKCLNLDEPEYSDFWNCLEEVIDPETERIDAMRLNEFAQIFIKNSSPLGDSQSENPFFVPSAEILLKAVIGYTAWECEKPILDNYIKLYRKVIRKPFAYRDPFIDKAEHNHVGFPSIRRVIMNEALKNGFEKEDIEKCFGDIKKYSSRKSFTIDEVYTNLKSNFDIMAGELSNDLLPDSNPAKAPWLTFNVSRKDDVKGQIIQGLAMRFSLFDNAKLREALSHPGMHISDVNKRQSAYFIILSDKNLTTKPIASLFFSFLFKDAQINWDKEAQIAKEKGVKNPCLNLVTMLDEFYSIGVIGGSPDAFGTIMSNSRKRHIYLSIIIQVYSQLEALYGPKIRDIIQAGCSTLIYLGGNDPATCEFISEFVSGESTILSETHSESLGTFASAASTNTNMRQDTRFVLTRKEANMWTNQVLVSKQGELPMKLNPFPWTEHPAYKNGLIQKQSIYSSIKPLTDKLFELEFERKESPEPYVNMEIDALGKVKLPNYYENVSEKNVMENNLFEKRKKRK